MKSSTATIDLHERIPELKALNLSWFNWKLIVDGMCNTDALDTPEGQAINSYFSIFMPFDGKCPGCQLEMDNGLLGFLLSGGGKVTRLEWSLAHGEAYCITCHWPYRVYHRNVGFPLPEFFQIGLPYHVRGLSMRGDADGNEHNQTDTH